MYRILLLGAGKIGSAIAQFLSNTGDYDVLVGDTDEQSLARIEQIADVKTVQLGYQRLGQLYARAMEGRQAVVSALSFALNPGVAQAAQEEGLSYFDLTEDRETTVAIRKIACTTSVAGQVFMPQQGLAPGFVSIVAHHLALDFERLDEVRLRVGALPQFPTNEMKYNLTWSTDGLINEYGNPCEAVHEGRLIEVLPLEGLEHFSLDGIDYEAFNTSGGVGTLAETLNGKVRSLDYKTIRYRGHRDLIAFLMNELRLNDRRALLKDILENAGIRSLLQDVKAIFCTVTGWKSGQLIQHTDARKIYHGVCFGDRWSAIQITTAGPAFVCRAGSVLPPGRLPDPLASSARSRSISMSSSPTASVSATHARRRTWR